MASGFKVANAYVSVVADDEGLRESMTAKIEAAAEGLNITVRMTADGAGVEAEVGKTITEAQAEADGDKVKVKVEVTGEDAVKEGVTEAIAEGQAEADADKVKIKVKVDDDGASQVDTALQQLGDETAPVAEQVGSSLGQKLGNGLFRDANGYIRNAAGQFASDAEQLGVGLEEVGTKADDAGGKVTQAGTAAAGAGNAANGAGGGFGGMSAMMMTVVGAAVALGPALAALPALLSGLGLGGIAAFGALKDVVGALTAANTAAAASGQTAAQAAQTAYSNAVAIRNAEQSIVDAKRASAIAAQNSADSIVAANQQVQQSEQSEAQAAQALAQAKIDAANQIADLNNSSADAANSVSDAQLNVQQAQQNLTSVMANSLSTDLQKKQAQQALKDAEQALIDAKQRSKEATEASTKADQEGVNGFPPVVQAQRAYEQAVLATANAQHALVVAERNAADQRISSAEAVQKAEQSLTDTIRQQQLAAAATAASASSGANAYAQAMAKLTPVGQEVVRMLLGMNTGFDKAAQNSFLPGILTFLKDVQPIMPQFIGMISLAGQAFGGFLAQIGSLFTQKQFVADFFTILQQGVGMMQTIGGGVIQMIQGVTSAAAGAGPIVSAVGTGIADILAAIGPLLQGLTSNATGAGQSIQAILGFVADLLGPLGTLIGAISGALGPALTLLRPILDQVVSVLVAGLTPIIKALSPILADVVRIFGDLVKAAAPLIAPISQIITLLLQAVTDVLTPLMPLIAQLANLFGQFLLSNINALIPVVEQLVQSVVKLMPVIVPLIQDLLLLMTAFAPLEPIIMKLADTVLATLLPPLTQLLLWLGKLVDYLVGQMAPAFSKTITQVVGWVGEAATGIEGFLGHIRQYWDDLIGFFRGIPGQIASALSGMWDFIWDGFRAAIDTVIRGWDSLSFTLPSINLGPLGSFGGWTIGVPQIPQLAEGGTTTAPGVVVVGERGPEALYLPKGATVDPKLNSIADRMGNGAQAGGSGGVHIDNLTIKVDGIVDLTNPNAMSATARTFVIRLRDALKLLDAAYS